MKHSRKIDIRSEDDVILARMETRRMARDAGLDVGGQARISLAASSLAHALDLGRSCEGHMDIGYVDGGIRSGVRIILTVSKVNIECFDPRTLSSANWKLMVDELDAQQLPPNGVQITAVKWAS
jgi:hypothetical protein